MTLSLLFYADVPGDEADNNSPRESTVRTQVVILSDVRREDAALVAAIRDGDTQAFEVIYRRHYAPMVAFVAPYVHDRDAAHELVSDLFLTLWMKRQHWTVRTSIATYLYQALRHRAANFRRHDAVGARHMARAAAQGIALGTGGPCTTPDDATLQRERAERLWEAVDALPEPRRTIVRLRWREGMGFDEIAAVVGTSAAAVQMQLSRALKVLRKTVSEL